MGRRKYTPHKIPTAWKGDKTVKVAHNFDKAFHAAIKEIADEESQRWGSKHGVAPVLMNLAMNNSDHFRDLRARIRKRYNELKKQEKHQREEDHQEIATEFQ